MKLSSLLLSGAASALCLSPCLGIDNGLGLTPPMGWRSWNCYHGDVSQKLMEDVMDAMVSKSRTVDGQPTSLLDLGYENCGLDDNWQACGAGAMKGFHDSEGNPLVRTDTFPNMSAMTEHGHSLGLRVGWYMNNCICGEHQYTDTSTPSIADIMEKSAAAVANYGFDGLKLDGCSEFRNLTWWGALLNATGRPILIENCHWGGTIPGDTTGDAPCSGTTTPSNCPYNFFRTSGDISSSFGSMMKNLQTTIKFSGLNGTTPLSRPGTWAYPDMLEVGNLANHQEDRTHFAAWSIVSAPLVLGFDLTNNETMDKVWDIIANPEAIAVNQAWEGDPGRLVKSFTPSVDDTTYVWGVPCNNSDPRQSFALKDDTIVSSSGNCFDSNSKTSGTIQTTACSGSASQNFTYSQSAFHQNNRCLDVFNFKGPVVQLFGCNGGTNQQFTFNSSGHGAIKDNSGQCLSENKGAPDESASSLQLWAKKLPGGAMAALLINGDSANHTATITPADIGLDMSKNYVVRDIFDRLDIATVDARGITTDDIASHDSRFYKFTPA